MELRVAREISSAVGFSPFYLLGNIDPTFFLLFFVGALFLVFDVDHLNARNRIADALHSRPVRNVEFLFGRVLGAAGLVWLIAAINLLAMQGFGLLAEFTGLGFGSVFELYSLFNLVIVDVPALLFLWCSLVVFLSIVLRFRVLVVSISLVFLIAWHHGVAGTPYSLLDLVSASSNDTLLISDIVPEFPSFASLVVRIGAVALAAAIIGIAAWLYQRRDSFSMWHTSVVVGSCVVASLAIVTATTNVFLRNSQVETWRQAHENYAWRDSVDIRDIAGTLLINPKDRLYFDLKMDFSLSTEDPTPKFTLVFNPGMKVSTLEINGSPSEFEFRKGILEVHSASPLRESIVHSMRIIAEGKPNPRFAYLDAPLDYLADPSLPIQVTHAFGKDGSLFDPNYVALMPGAHWYPNTQRYGSEFGERPDPDFFSVNLEVELSNPDWHLVGPGVSKIDNEGVNKYSVMVDHPIPQLGLFASEFESASTTLAGITLTAHTHVRHPSILNVTDEVLKELLNGVESSFNQAWGLGLKLTQPSLSFVEVPSRLRTVGGGWRMDALNALPGVVLVKERTFPVANTILKNDENESEVDVYRALVFSLNTSLGTDNCLRTTPAHYWTHFTAASGVHSEVLDLIVTNLLWSTSAIEGSFSFSPYSTIHLVPLTMLSTSVTQDLRRDRFELFLADTLLGGLESRFISRDAVWERLVHTSFASIPSGLGHQADLELVLLKSRLIAEGLLYYHRHEYEKILSWLMAIRDRFAGHTYGYADLLELAEEHDVEVSPFLTDWLTSSRLPGFEFSAAKAERISDDTDGNLRLQVTLDVRNRESAPGIVVPRLHNFLYEQPIRFGPNSSKRINLVLTNPPLDRSEFKIYMYSALSLNREITDIHVDLSNIGTSSEVSPVDYIEDSNWRMESLGIVIDDLDPGFTIGQPNVAATRSLTSGPIGWFRSYRPTTDHILGRQGIESVYQPKRGWWMRVEEANAYGMYRQTAAVASVGNWDNLQPVRFNAVLPESDLWKLDYHIPQSHMGQVHDIKLRVSNGSDSWDVLLDHLNISFGWNLVGEFDLSQGNAAVEVLGSTQRSTLYADAIRWTQANEGE